MPAKRILVVIDGMEVGGSQRQIIHLLTGLDRNLWQPELAYFRGNSFLVETLRDAGIPVHVLPKRGRVDLRFIDAFSRLLRQGDYALVHAFSLTAELWSVLARFASGCRPLLIASERNQYLDKPAWYWWIKRAVLRRCVAVIANSTAGARTTARHTRLPVSLFDTVANGVDAVATIGPAERGDLRASLGVPPGRVFGLFVGRLVAQKNLECLVRALALLDAGERPWIALAGEGPLRDRIQQLAVDTGVARDVVFLGERRDTSKLMQAADFLVLPSHFEGLSNALLEAMAAGCAVIASAVGGTPELIEDGRTGLLFAADSTPALSTCMARLAADPALRQHLSAQALEYVRRHHGVDRMVDETTAVYGRCLAPRQQPVGAEARHFPAAVLGEWRR